MALTPEERKLRAKFAAHVLHAQVEDPSAHTKPARDAFNARFDREVDPDGKLSPKERARRADHARKAYFTAMAFRSARARRARADGGEAA